MIKKILLLLITLSFVFNIQISTASASNLDLNLIETNSIESKTFKVTRSSYDVLLLPPKIWYSSGGYAGYLYLDTYSYESDLLWYGVYKGTLLKGPFQNNVLPILKNSKNLN